MSEPREYQMRSPFNARPVDDPQDVRSAIDEACTYNSYEGGQIEGINDDLRATRRVVSKLVEVLVEKGLFDEIDVLKLLSCSKNEWTLAPEEGSLEEESD